MTTAPPTIYVTNAGSVVQVRQGRATEETRRCVGSRSQLTIMARPRPAYGEAGVGRVEALTPTEAMLDDAQSGWISIEEYRRQFVAMVEAHGADAVAPGSLAFRSWDRGPMLRVEDGDTLTCACSRAEAANGRCHRVWAAAILLRAGWRVVLDGREYDAGWAREQISPTNEGLRS